MFYLTGLIVAVYCMLLLHVFLRLPIVVIKNDDDNATTNYAACS